MFPFPFSFCFHLVLLFFFVIIILIVHYSVFLILPCFLRYVVAQFVDALSCKPEDRDFVGIFHLLNPSGRTTAPESTQSLTEMSTSGIF